MAKVAVAAVGIVTVANAPLSSAVPAPVTERPSLRIVVPPLKWRKAVLAMVTVPASEPPPLIEKVVAEILTLPVLLNATSKIATPVPVVRVNAPEFVKATRC